MSVSQLSTVQIIGNSRY